jgi:hypothetical protein
MNNSKSPKPTPCRYIKSKNSFGMLEDGSNWSGIEDPNATYWCNKSAGPVGPDNGIVGPKTCMKGRKCFENM